MNYNALAEQDAALVLIHGLKETSLVLCITQDLAVPC